MKQIVEMLRSTFAGLLGVLFLWHLYRAARRLATRGGGPQVRRRRVPPQDDPHRNVPIDPR